MKRFLLTFFSIAVVSTAFANTAPVPLVVSAAMRPGTTLMDVVYRVNDPDDATVKVRALAFVDGVRSFAKVLRPVTFVEGTASKIGDAIPSNTNHTLTWDVGADWNIDLGQLKFEILTRDARGLLPFDWITIPAAAGNPALTISKDSPSDASVLSALFWQYADGDPWLNLANGVLTGNAGSGVFADLVLANSSALQAYSAAYIFKRMNLDPAEGSDINHAVNTARAGLISTTNWHAVNKPYTGVTKVQCCGYNQFGQCNTPVSLNGVVAIAGGGTQSLALKNGGIVVAWGSGAFVPTGLTGVTSIASGWSSLNLALKSDGTVVAWGSNSSGEGTVPPGLTGVIAIAAGSSHGLALKGDGMVVAWGNNANGQTTIPVGLSGVVAIAAGPTYNLALKSDGTVTGWGSNSNGETNVPLGLTGVTAIAAGASHCLALKNDGTVVAWGYNFYGQATPPAGLSGVTAIAAGGSHSLALKSDGAVVAWGNNQYGQATLPAGWNGFSAIAAGANHSILLKSKAP